MRKLFRFRNLLILFGLGIVVGIVISKKNSAPAPAYPDPWASPQPAGGASDPVAAPASSNGSGLATPDASEAPADA